uniref:M28 family peptidase n=1 Tax=uncultured Polaribacter sp. TaxID=174711 RepID=UPI00260C30A4|nr:M28 family peptidase [uncultured Polaribacter sp.]
MKNILFLMLCFFVVFVSCKEPKVIEINSEELLQNLKELSDDSYRGRLFSSPEGAKARKFIVEKFKDAGLQPINGEYEHEFSATLKKKQRQDLFPIKKNPLDDYSNVPDTTVVGGNAFGILNGETNKTIVITAHYDHLGVINEKIYNGADDNASGISALFTIAKYFKNKPTKHNLVFAAVDAEEVGSLGADYFLKNFNNRENIVLNVNLDMIAHSDYDPELFGSGLYHYPDLRDPLEDVHSEKIMFLFGHDDPNNREQADWTFSSDHKVFYRSNIPHMYFGVPDHKDYHRYTDTYATINEAFFIEAVKVIIQSIENLDQHLYEEAN